MVKEHSRHAISISLVIIGILAFVALGNLPYLAGVINYNPAVLFSGMAFNVHFVYNVLLHGIHVGYPEIDPNVGFVTQALGHLAAQDILHLRMPYWNPYEGLGTPLLGEMQSAALFPVTLLQAFSNGALYELLTLEASAGIGTFLLLKKLGCSQVPSLVGAMAFSLNGTFTWLTHAPSNPVPMLPFIIFGLEEIFYGKSLCGILLIGLFGALSFYAGFPETTYIEWIFTGGWLIVRILQNPRRSVKPLLGFCAGVLIAVALALPVLVPFADFVKYAFIGIHTNTLESSLPTLGIPQLFMPYIYGPIFGFPIPTDWGAVGGYAGILMPCLGLLALLRRKSQTLSAYLFVWIIFALTKTFGSEPGVALFNILPFAANVAFNRYAPPTWEFALAILTAFALDAMYTERHARKLFAASFIGMLIFIFLSIYVWSSEIMHLFFKSMSSLYISWLKHYLFITLLPLLVALLAMFVRRPRLIVYTLSIATLAEVLMLHYVPMFSAPVSATIDYPAIHFLKRAAKLWRVYSLGPLNANYGSYYGIALLDYNDLPVPYKTANYSVSRLDPFMITPSILLGTTQRAQSWYPSQQSEFKLFIQNYQRVSTRYVITLTGQSQLNTTTTGMSVLIGSPVVSLPLNSASSYEGLVPRNGMSGELVGIMVPVTPSSYLDGGYFVARLCIHSICSLYLSPVTTNNIYNPALLTSKKPIKFPKIKFVHLSVTLAHLPNLPPSSALISGLHSNGSAGFYLVFKNPGLGLPIAYRDKFVTIYELPHAASFYSVDAGNCKLSRYSWNKVMVKCATPGLLVRRELFMPGWKASEAHSQVQVEQFGGIFQAVKLRPGSYYVSFYFVPPHEQPADIIAVVFVLVWVSIFVMHVKRPSFLGYKKTNGVTN